MIYINLLIIFVIIVFIHEFGHYFFARLFNVKVTDFSIGFGKILYEYKDKRNTKWKISLIPLGGYVKIKGLESIFRNKNIDIEANSFENISLIKKIFVLLAGSFFNIISAWICLFFIFFFSGIINYQPIVGGIIEGSAAYKNDIRKGDIIESINGTKIKFFNDIPNVIKNKKSISIDIIRKNKLISKEFNLIFDEKNNNYLIGIKSNNNPQILKYNFLSSIKRSVYFIPIYYNESFKYLKKSYDNNNLTNELAGPIGIVKMADQLMLNQIKGIAFIFISISLFVGLFNLFPIPLLDGGHIFYFTLRKIFSNSLPLIITRIYLITGITIISFLFIYITFNDIFYK